MDKSQPIRIGGISHNAIHLRQLPQAGQEKTTEVWLVPWTSAAGQKSYLPARIRITQSNGDFAEQTAKALPD